MTIHSYKCGPGFGTRGESAYRLRATGMPWVEIMATLKANSDSAIVKVAKKCAIAHGLPWPIPQPVIAAASPEDAPPTALEKVRRVQKEAYDLRVDGASWESIATETDPVTGQRRYSAVSHAVAGAKRYAARAGKPWPIPQGTETRSSSV